MLELMNVYRLNTLHANSDTRAKGLLHLVSETSGCRLEYNLSPQGQRFALRRCPDSKINTGLLLHIYGLCTPFFLPTLTLLKVEKSRRRQILSGAIQRTDNFLNVFSDISYVRVSLEDWVVFIIQ